MESKDWSGFGYFSSDLEKIKQLLVCSKHHNTWEDTGNVVKAFFSIQSKKKNVKEGWVFNAICRKSCHQLVIELTKIYLDGINRFFVAKLIDFKTLKRRSMNPETGVWIHW